MTLNRRQLLASLTAGVTWGAAGCREGVGPRIWRRGEWLGVQAGDFSWNRRDSGKACYIASALKFRHNIWWKCA